MLLFLTKDVYEKEQNDLSAVKNTPFASIYGFYNNKTDENTTVFDVSSRLGGSEKLTVTNGTKLNCELRLDSPTGETLGYVEAQNAGGKTFMLNEGEYTIFPVFRKLSEANGEIYTFVPEMSDGKAFYEQIRLQGGSKQLDVTAISNKINFDLVALESCYFRITNNNRMTAVSFRNGVEAMDLPSSIGFTLINPGETVSYEIKFTANSDITIPKTQKMENLAVWAGYNNSDYFKTNADNYNWERGHIYEVNVRGDEPAKLPITVVDKGMFNIKEMLGL